MLMLFDFNIGTKIMCSLDSWTEKLQESTTFGHETKTTILAVHLSTLIPWLPRRRVHGDERSVVQRIILACLIVLSIQEKSVRIRAAMVLLFLQTWPPPIPTHAINPARCRATASTARSRSPPSLLATSGGATAKAAPVQLSPSPRCPPSCTGK